MIKEKKFRTISYIVLAFYIVLTIYPFLWAILAAFKPYSEIVGGGLTLMPKEFTLDNFRYIFTEDPLFPLWVRNSIIIAVIGTVLNVIFNSMCGYALARLSFKGKKSLLVLVMIAIMVPAQILLIPNYLIMKSLGLLDTYSALIIPSAINFSYIFMMRQFYLSFPKEIEEAAQLDGLSRLSIFFRIVMPMSKASLGTQAIFVFLGFWNDFMKPLLYITTQEKYTLTLGLQSFQSQHATQWNYIMAAAVVTIAPIIILYIVLNKYFMRSDKVGGDK
ncbi:carbohydrate ABC transporter permease [Vagococcus fluvialis]|uniref:ABC transporter permease n=1 Tax=Vagococcus fluvialis TaxID=2738 RepID=A0A369AQF2_9ENTE|nr:carbohydrate ABC transporter permease [Vagococcus fluvialis]MDT2746910.1 carbohydrate ABC transporter permease [Vagococcus fluvialis]RCX10568.1 carbohydrate ABC transporter membrane protein 2 (CUT1 family) [Vagococcus fluvialis]RST99421.1 ABC transporter permease [Vagococcus fluvialis]UDM74564.1 carbohydrate ABC transporter permease [Vagococcus fluvialis]